MQRQILRKKSPHTRGQKLRHGTRIPARVKLALGSIHFEKGLQAALLARPGQQPAAVESSHCPLQCRPRRASRCSSVVQPSRRRRCGCRQGPVCDRPKAPSARPGLESEAKPAAATPADYRQCSNRRPITRVLSCLDGLPSLGRCRPAGGGHFDLQASVMAGCQCFVLVFWSPRRSPSHHHTFLATTSLFTTPCCH